MLFPETVITGCGNPLYADDGFGPAVIEGLRIHSLPPDVKAIDAGTGSKEFVFSLLDPTVTKRLIIVDAVDFKAEPGTITLVSVSPYSEKGITDRQPGGIAASLSEMPGIKEIIIVGCQPKWFPYPEVFLGLSQEVQSAIPRAIWIIFKILEKEQFCYMRDFIHGVPGTICLVPFYRIVSFHDGCTQIL